MKFLAVEQIESSEKLNNPRRGFFRMVTFCLDQQPDFTKLETCLADGLRLFLVFIDIGAYRDQTIPEEAQFRMLEIMRRVTERSDIILRIAYDRLGKGFEKEPGTLDQVIEHMEILGRIVARFEKHVLVYQGLFIGSWGEMHSSKFTSPDRLKKLYNTYKNSFDHVRLAVRKPSHIRCLMSEERIKSQNIGLFDDAIFGSVDHLGTYGIRHRSDENWTDSWCPEDERKFIAERTERVPFGGEAICGEEKNFLSCVNEMQQLHVTYLSIEHDPERIAEWKNAVVADGIFRSKAAIDYIEAKLGYRYVVSGVKFVKQGFIKRHYFLDINVKNVGFAASDIPLHLYVTDAAGNMIRIGDASRISGNKERHYTVEIPRKRGTFRLKAILKTGEEVLFANENKDIKGVILGKLK